MKQSRQQSERAFTEHTFFRHRGHRQWITRSCVAERPTADMVLGAPPHSQNNGNVRYSILGTLSPRLSLRNLCICYPRFTLEFFQHAHARTMSAMVSTGGMTTDMRKRNWQYHAIQHHSRPFGFCDRPSFTRSVDRSRALHLPNRLVTPERAF